MKIAKRHQDKNNIVRLTPADALSMISAMLALLSIIIIFRTGDYYLVSGLLIVCVILDFLDGKVARALNHNNDFGKNIDSLTDIVAFGVAPAVFMQQFISGYFTFIPCLIVLAGIYRLARYNVTNNKYFTGMPITANGLIVPVFYFAGLFNSTILIVLSIVISILMVSKIRITKVI